MGNKNKYIIIGLSLWAFVSLLLHSYIAAEEGTKVMTAPIVINFLIAYFLLKSKWAKVNFLDSRNDKSKLIGIGFGFSFVIFIVQNILGAVVFSQL